MEIKKFFRCCMLMATAWCMTVTLPACSDDDDEVKGPKFHMVDATVSVEANADCREAFTLSSVVTKPNGEQVDLTKFSQGGATTVSAFELPTTFSLEMTAEPEADFTPQEGKSYNFNIKYSYEVAVLDENEGSLSYVGKSSSVISSGSYKTDPESIKGLLQSHFPFKLVFTVKATGNSEDPYSITVEEQ